MTLNLEIKGKKKTEEKKRSDTLGEKMISVYSQNVPPMIQEIDRGWQVNGQEARREIMCNRILYYGLTVKY